MMAMRLYGLAAFEAELERRGCQKLNNHPQIGFFWRAPDGRHFIVPFPEEDNGSGYPDWMLDEIIEAHQLPAAPHRH